MSQLSTVPAFDPAACLDRATDKAKVDAAAKRAAEAAMCEETRNAFEPLVHAFRVMFEARKPVARNWYLREKEQPTVPLELPKDVFYWAGNASQYRIVIPVLYDSTQQGLFVGYDKRDRPAQPFEVYVERRLYAGETNPTRRTFSHWLPAFEYAVALLAPYVVATTRPV